MGAELTYNGQALEPARFDRASLLAAWKTGALDALERFEMIEGVLVAMSPSRNAHALLLPKLASHLITSVNQRFAVAVDASIFLDEQTKLAPDISLLTPPVNTDYASTEDIALIIEIADATLDKDLRMKAALYAKAGIEEYWVVDIAGRLLHIHRQPGASGYGDIQKCVWSNGASPLCAPDLIINLEKVSA
ncbi:MAG: Uma2 family endonuclease [Ahrensia sp.]|nr:Uma2 family endonuclease [Ahrensia sp.]